MKNRININYSRHERNRGGASSDKIKKSEKLYLLNTCRTVKSVLNKGVEIKVLSKSLASMIHKQSQYMLLVGNDIPKAELDKYELIEFEDYLYEKYMDKKIVVIYGNCHTTVISEIFSQCPEFKKIYEIYPIKQIHTITNSTYFNEPIFKWCDLFVHQSIQKGNRYGEEFSSESVLAHINSKCQVMAIPNVYQLPVCFFPQYVKEPEFTRRKGYGVFFRDSILDRGAENGLSYKAIATDYWNGVHFEGSYLDDMLWVFFTKIEKREKDWDIKCSEYIRNHYKTEKLFYDPNHPTNIFLFYVAMQCLEYLGIETQKKSLEDYELTLLTGYEMPLLPEVKRHFGMIFPDNPEMRKHSYNKIQAGTMKGYKDYVKQYLSCEWQNKNVSKIYALKWHGMFYLMKIYNKLRRLILLLERK